LKDYTNRFVIALIGAGQLGSRYLQGFASCKVPIEIWVADPSEAALATARVRWEEVASVPHSHTVRYSTTLNDLPASLDLCLVTTTADVRLQVVRQVQSQCKVRYWVLEKVLAQSTAQLADLEDSLKDAEGVWVNTARRMVEWHQRIRKALPKGECWQINGSGENWGLACNSIHFIDLTAWWTGEVLEKVNASGLEHWNPSKRKGFWEVNGSLLAHYSGGSELELVSSPKLSEPFTMHFTSAQGEYLLNESNGTFIGPNGVDIPGRVEFQSEITGRLVDQILLGGICSLPKLSESAQMHKILIEGLLRHWNETQQRDNSLLPIT